jgi:hypothetical protein
MKTTHSKSGSPRPSNQESSSKSLHKHTLNPLIAGFHFKLEEMMQKTLTYFMDVLCKPSLFVLVSSTTQISLWCRRRRPLKGAKMTLSQFYLQINILVTSLIGSWAAGRGRKKNKSGSFSFFRGRLLLENESPSLSLVWLNTLLP